MPEGAGLFLQETWRLHPAVCAFTSEIFYEGKLRSHGGCARQEVLGDAPFTGAGLWWVPAPHEGNQSASVEEVEAVVSIYQELTSGRASWRNPDGDVSAVSADDVLLVAPYNLQVTALSKRLPNARVGTVDEFQGQEAVVVIYSMTSSSAEEAPRGMEFLYSRPTGDTAGGRRRIILVEKLPGVSR